MSDEYVEQWGTESGLTTNYTGTVAEAWFGSDERAQDPTKVYLFWRVVNLDLDEGDPQDEHVERISIGNGWEVAEGGQKVVHETGSPTKKFNANTGLGQIINRCLGEKGGQEGNQFKEQFVGAFEHLANFSPRDAQAWVGMRFRIEPFEFSFTDRESDEKVTRSRNVPVAFVGIDKPGGGSSGASGGGTSSSNGGLSKADRMRVEIELKKIAKDAGDHNQFLEAALSVAGVDQDDALFESVADASEAGFFAQNH